MTAEINLNGSAGSALDEALDGLASAVDELASELVEIEVYRGDERKRRRGYVCTVSPQVLEYGVAILGEIVGPGLWIVRAIGSNGERSGFRAVDEIEGDAPWERPNLSHPLIVRAGAWSQPEDPEVATPAPAAPASYAPNPTEYLQVYQAGIQHALQMRSVAAPEPSQNNRMMEILLENAIKPKPGLVEQAMPLLTLAAPYLASLAEQAMTERRQGYQISMFKTAAIEFAQRMGLLKAEPEDEGPDED